MRFTVGIAALFALTLVSALAFAQPDPGSDPDRFIQTVFGALGSRDWLGATALLLIGAVWVAREKLPITTWVPWFKTRWGGTVLALLLASLGAVASTVFSTHRLNVSTLLNGFYVGLAAIGGWEVLKDTRKGNK